MARFICDSGADTLHIDSVDFVNVPLTISTAEETWTDDASLNVGGMIEYLAAYKNRSFSACPAVDLWLHAYAGADTIYVITITGTLSGSYNSALVAAGIYKETNPNARVHVFDSKSAGPELRLLLEKLIELDRQGLSFKEVCAAGEAYLKTTRIYFSFQSLHNFAMNGRVPKVLANAIGVLNMRIVGSANEHGELEPISKPRGDKKALAEIMSLIEKSGFSGGKIRITHALNFILAKELAGMLAARYPGADIWISEARGLCSYYGEKGAVFVAIETK